MPKFSDIKQLTHAHYHVTVDFAYLEHHIHHYIDEYKGQLDPDFQRGHVWTREQQIAYVEFKLKGGKGASEILWNCPGWQVNFKGPLQLVDGLQRVTAALAFIHNEIPAFGHYYKEYDDPNFLRGIYFDFYVNNLSTKAQVLEWYLELNEGGVVHSKEELARVHSMLENIKTKRS